MNSNVHYYYYCYLFIIFTPSIKILRLKTKVKNRAVEWSRLDHQGQPKSFLRKNSIWSLYDYAKLLEEKLVFTIVAFSVIIIVMDIPYFIFLRKKYNLWLSQWLVIMTTLFFRDTAGQERFRTITTAYYRGAMVCLHYESIKNLPLYIHA